MAYLRLHDLWNTNVWTIRKQLRFSKYCNLKLFQNKKDREKLQRDNNLSNGTIDLKSLIIATFCKIILISWNKSFLFEAKRNFNISPEVTSYSYDLSNEDTVCAEINVLTLAGEKLQKGRIQCYTTGKKSSLCKLMNNFVSRLYLDRCMFQNKMSGCFHRFHHNFRCSLRIHFHSLPHYNQSSEVCIL